MGGEGWEQGIGEEGKGKGKGAYGKGMTTCVLDMY